MYVLLVFRRNVQYRLPISVALVYTLCSIILRKLYVPNMYLVY